MSTTITRDEWLSALAAATPSENDGMTTKEITAMLGRHDPENRSVRRMIDALIQAGAVECVMAPRRQVNGVMRSVPVYRLKKTTVQ